MKSYVIGFMFNPDLSRVALVKKNRPAWQAGLWNGIGGHIEEGEQPLAAMQREFFEETGVPVEKQGEWRQVSYLTDNEGYSIDIFAVASDGVSDATTMTDENIARWSVEEVLHNRDELIFNIPWLILMAREQLLGRDPATFYRIEH